ncbi:NmrA family NAD(P)-binding protein [Rufibacter sp. LB8]|uniref:NmrA family NAD(P)-binding protein n=1 Tax=Rufibacter sp. LB8 TaxID=2777781 RepID=UPI00178C665B|nr:NmrA family NAD(P)-binding protein [Rufibacter sp. LB8]
MSTTSATIILAGATGDLGRRIARFLKQRGAHVRALVRPGTEASRLAPLHTMGVTVVEVDFNNAAALAKACEGGTCVVSALSGLREVMIDAQTQLLNAAVAASVPKFIPSDFSIDFTKLPRGQNRNLDFRKEFQQILDKAPIQATSVLNGMFADLLTGQAPIVLQGISRIMFYGNPDQPLDFTTIENTAEFTAAAALDPTTPRFLRIAGDVLTARGLQAAASQALGKPFKLFRVGGLGVLKGLITATKTLAPAKGEVFPAWQGMQYMYDMFTGLPKLSPLDNDRYPDITFTPVHQVLATKE